MTFQTPTRLLTPLLFALLLLAGCDSGPEFSNSELLVPNTSSLDFQTEEGDADTLQLTLTYQNLSSLPAPDEDIPPYYAVTELEQTGTPSDGETTYEVIFTAPEPSGSYATPVRFRSGEVVTTVRFGGLSIGGPETISDFTSGEVDYTQFGGGIVLNLENEQLRIDMTSVGGPGQFPGMFKAFDAPINFEATPIVAVRMMVTADSEGPARVRAALNQSGDLPDANATVPDLLANVPADGEYRTYYFDFRNNFVQFDGQPVNPANIGEIVFLFNDNIEPPFTGTLFMDIVERRPTIPPGAENPNLPPTADFSFSPVSPAAGEQVTFTDRSTDSDGVLESFEWDFGDGATGSGVEPTHTYAEPGDYTVTLTVTDDAGATAQTTGTITVTDGGTSNTVVFDDFEDGLQDGEYFIFSETNAGVAQSTDGDVPAASDGTSAYLVEFTNTGSFAGFGKSKFVDLEGLGTDPYMNFYVRTNAANAFTLEINLQEDQDGNGSFDGDGATDDEFLGTYDVQPGSEYTLVSLPLSSFSDKNTQNSGGDGELSNTIANIVFVVGGLDGTPFNLRLDDIVFTKDSLGGTSGQ